MLGVRSAVFGYDHCIYGGKENEEEEADAEYSLSKSETFA